jgi:hypothetical protein
MIRWLSSVWRPGVVRYAAASDDDEIVLACPACGSLRTRIVEVDVIARMVTLTCQDCGVVSPGVRY